MKKIIEGIRYDTEKAITIGEGGHGNPRSGDFSHWEATLYKTPKSGRFFLVGTGGPMTMFGERFPDGMRGSGTRLIPMSLQEAFEWAQRHLETTEVEEHFGDLIEDA